VLAAPSGDTWRGPSGGEIRGQAIEVGHRHRGIWRVHCGEARSASLHTAQRGLPVLLQLRGDETVLRVAGGIAAFGQGGVVLGLLQVEFRDTSTFGLAVPVHPLGLQCRLDGYRLHRT
jgi:hypothetical protein